MTEMNISRAGITWLTEAGDIPPTGTLAADIPFHNFDWATAVPWQNTCLVLSVILAIGSYLWIHRWAQRNVAGPKGWPVVGSVPLVIKNWPRYYDFILEFFEQGHDVICLNLGFGLRLLFLAEPSLVEYVLKTNFNNYPKGRKVTKFTEDFLGQGIFSVDHEAWKVQRKVASFEFSSAVLRDFSTDVFKESGIKLLRIISNYAESNRPMDLQDLFMRMTLDATSKLGFGVDLGCLSKSIPAVPFATAFDRANELSYHRYLDPWRNLKRYLGIAEEKELSDCLQVIDSFSYDVIRKRRAEMSSREAGKVMEEYLVAGGMDPVECEFTAGLSVLSLQTKPDLLSRFMSLTDGDNEGYSDQHLRDVILNFILAGRDTTGLTLSWFMYELCQHPEVELKILEEIQLFEEEGFAKVGQELDDHYTKFAELMTYRNLGRLNYLHAALSETLRLHPAVPMDGKTALADDVLPNGTLVKKGTLVTYSPYCMGRLEKVWGPDAKSFRPERWLKDGIFQPESPFKFITFNAGPRSCLGKDSAYLQMKMTAALLVKFFKFQVVPAQKVAYRVMFVLTINGGIQVTASRR